MRVQIQWDTSGSNVVYSEAVVASDAAAGVTVAEASAALLRVHAQLPSKAAKAAQLAVDRALAWIRNRPPSGVSAIGNVHTRYFPYQSFTDARVDIENWYGTNLRG